MSAALARYQRLNREWKHVVTLHDNWCELCAIIEKDLQYVWLQLDPEERNKITDEYETGRRYNTSDGPDRGILLPRCRFCS